MSISSISNSFPSVVPSPPSPAASTETTSGVAQAASVLSSLTPSDRTLIAAATGVVISPSGVVMSGAGFESSAAGDATNEFAVVIATARQLGQLQGKITPQELASLFPPYISSGSSGGTTPVNAQHVANAARYLQSGADGQGSAGSGFDASA